MSKANNTDHNNSDKNQDKSKLQRINVTITYSYTTETNTIENILAKITSTNLLSLNDLIEDLIENKNCKSLYDTAISYYDNDLKNYIYCGIYPFDINITIPLTQEVQSCPTLQIRSRNLIKKENLMRMDLNEEINAESEDNNQNIYINQKSKRSKERKIGYIIEKVFLWRKLYNGFSDENGNLIKLTLEEAADKVGISKKSLDDYLIQLR